MIEQGRIKVGVDYDGVVIKKARAWDLLRRATKFGLSTNPGALKNMTALAAQEDVDLLGIYTVRPPWLRRRQTARQILRRHIPVERVTHTSNSPKRKIEALLLAAAGFDGQVPSTGEIVLPRNMRQIVLIDDSVEKVIAGAVELASEKPHFKPLFELFTLAAFNPKHPDQVEDMSVPGTVRVVSMRNWDETGKVLAEVKTNQ